MASSTSLTMTYDVLPDTKVLAMHMKEEQPVIKLTSQERFYTDVSRVYEHLMSVENDGNDDSEMDDVAAEDESKNEEQQEAEGTVFGGIMGDLDKARFQLDEMMKIIDMLTGSGPSRELKYVLSAPVAYPVMTSRHFAALCSQKRDQLGGVADILQRGVKSVHKAVQRGRTFSKDLVHLSKHWRLASLDVLRNDESMEFMGNLDARSNAVFIDFRVRRRRNNLDGLLPLYRSGKNGNITIRLDHPSALIAHISGVEEEENDGKKESEAEKEVTEPIGFDDADISDSSEDEGGDDEDGADTEDGDELMIPNCSLSTVGGINAFLYHQQVYLLYSEVYRVLKTSVQNWDPSRCHGIRCRLQGDNITVHSPSFEHDFVIQFVSPSFDAHSELSNVTMASKQWNKMIICGQDIDENVSAEIEHNVIKMIKDGDDRNRKTNVVTDCHSLRSLKHIESEHHSQFASERRLWNMNSRIGRFEQSPKDKDDVKLKSNMTVTPEGEDTDQDRKCQLEYIINHVNWYRLQQRLKNVLKEISTTTTFNIQWNQSNVKSIVNAVIEKRGKLLLSITLDGMKLSVLKYETPESKRINYLRQTQCSKLMPCHTVAALENLIRSFA